MDEAAVLALFLQLVQLTSPSRREGKVAAFCAKELKRLGFRVEFDGAGDSLAADTGNLIATLDGDAARIPLLLIAHMDTVAPGTDIRPQLGQDGIIRADGSAILGADDKAGITAILAALRELVGNEIPHGPIQVVLTIAEELGLQGSARFDPVRLSAQFGLCLDAEGEPGTFVVSAPSQVRWQADVLGRAAPVGGAPENGISAIQVAARAVARIPHGRVDADTTVNIGTFIGEGPRDLRRDRVRLAGDARGRNHQRLLQVLREMECIFAEVAKAHGASVDFSFATTCMGFAFALDHPLLRMAETAARRVGLIPRWVVHGDGSDAHHFTAMGVPTLNAGVGYRDIHTPKERIALADLVRTARFVYEFLVLA
ncbi:MAG: M20/M25/M40 family metallo-hydrolase [Alicyclobacillus shizuokensis]|nr:M20/M25/M40 family metallo-hydrolase [Alicyclobacillus shizuokensis]